jgi:hypothetical protein
MKSPRKLYGLAFALVLSSAIALAGPQTAATAGAEEYRPKFAGDPARSQSEALALGYMRVVLTAERLYKQKHGKYAATLPALVGHGSFTKRMTDPNRGDYKVRFKGTGDGFALWMDARPQPSPRQRSFFADERGAIRAEESQSAGPDSPVAKR